MTGARLEAKDIVIRYGGLTAVNGMCISAAPGEVTALIGPNGAGKTSLFSCLGGAIAPSSGQILLDGKDITRLSIEDRAHRGLKRTFQRLAVFPTMTVEDNLMVGAETKRRSGFVRGTLGLKEPSAPAACAVVEQVITQLGLESSRHARANTLSTGTLRLVELGRALCSQPRVLLLDEPASGLDDHETRALRDVLRSVAADGVTVMLVEHDVALVLDVADQIFAMSDGHLLAHGTPDEIRSNKAVRSAYLETTRRA